MKPPCEMVVWYIIPAIRSELAKDLLKLGMKQKKISELMDITQPAVSQYLTDKRGSGIEFNDDVKALIQDFANDLNEGTATKLDGNGVVTVNNNQAVLTDRLLKDVIKAGDNIKITPESVKFNDDFTYETYTIEADLDNSATKDAFKSSLVA